MVDLNNNKKVQQIFSKTRMFGLSDGKEIVLVQYRSVMDRQTCLLWLYHRWQTATIDEYNITQRTSSSTQAFA